MKTNLNDTINDFEKCYKSNPNAVKKGVALFNENKIEYKSHDDGIINFAAEVPDEYGGICHTVIIKLYKGSGIFVDGNCTCRPNRITRLLCKHIVAATLTVQRDVFGNE